MENWWPEKIIGWKESVVEEIVQWLELLEGSFLKREKEYEGWVPILVLVLRVSPGSGGGRGKGQQKAKREKVNEGLKRLNIMKDEEGMEQDVGLPSCQIGRS